MKNHRNPDPAMIHSTEEYTYEDYITDFELDYLGFDGVPDGPVSDISSEKNSGKRTEKEDQ